MKTKLKFTIGVLILLISSFSGFSIANINRFEDKVEVTEVQGSRVYVCGGQYSTKLHSYTSCRGLNNCKGGIFYYDSQQEAINAGYSYCSICWR